MDTLHPVAGAKGSYLDGKRRRPLPLPTRLHPGLPPYSGDCAIMALHHGLRFCAHRSFLRHRPADEHAVGAACAHFARCLRAGVEHLRPLCQLHLPPEPNGFYGYNALQQLAYFATVFVMAPLAIFTGMAMSPALVNRFPLYTKIFGGRQGARSIHFLVLVGFIGFIGVHVALVALTGFQRNMNHIVLGTDGFGPAGMILGFVGIAVVLLSWVGAHYISWFFPRGLQHAQKAVTHPVMLLTLDKLIPQEHYTAKDISPHMWPNGKMPVREDWKQLAAEGFKGYKLKVSGLIENPVELSLDDLRVLGLEENITMHHCIQGWSGIAQWGGVSMRKLIEHVKPLPSANVVAFYSFGGSLYGDLYYDTQTLFNALKPECLLALSMNGAPLAVEYGAPLRLRVENQLGYKMVKWIERIEFVTSEKTLGEGEGGINEDDEYFDLLPNI